MEILSDRNQVWLYVNISRLLIEMGVEMCAFGGLELVLFLSLKNHQGFTFLLAICLKQNNNANQISLTRSSLSKLKQTGRNGSQLAMNSRQARL